MLSSIFVPLGGILIGVAWHVLKQQIGLGMEVSSLQIRLYQIHRCQVLGQSANHATENDGKVDLHLST